MSHFFKKNGTSFIEVTEDEFIAYIQLFKNEPLDLDFEQWCECWLRLNFLFKLTDKYVRIAYIEFDA